MRAYGTPSGTALLAAFCLWPVAAKAAPPAGVASEVERFASAGRACLAVLTQESFDQSVLTARGWSSSATPTWAKTNATRVSFGQPGSEVLLSVVSPQLFHLAKFCTVEGSFAKGSDFAKLMADTAKSVGLLVMDLGSVPIKAAKDEYFFGGGGQPMMAATKAKINGKDGANIRFMARRAK